MYNCFTNELILAGLFLTWLFDDGCRTRVWSYF